MFWPSQKTLKSPPNWRTGRPLCLIHIWWTEVEINLEDLIKIHSKCPFNLHENTALIMTELQLNANKWEMRLDTFRRLHLVAKLLLI